MASPKKRAEAWRTFIFTRFAPQLWGDIKPRLWTIVLGVITGVLILLAQLHFGVITDRVHPRILSILWPYALLVVLLVAYHLARTPWLISNEHLETIASLRKTIEIHEATINQRETELRVASEKPKRNAAEQADYNTIKRAIDEVVKDKGKTALRFLRNKGTIDFVMRFGSPVSGPTPPQGLTLNDLAWVYHHCESEGIVTMSRGMGGNSETFTISPHMNRALGEVLFEE